MATILVVEDEEDIRKILAYNLGQAGFDVVAVDRGEPVLAMVRTNRPELVLLDLMLPDISGLEICRHLKSDPGLRAIPIIMLTARSEEIDRVVGFELGADDYCACRRCSAAHHKRARQAPAKSPTPSWSSADCASTEAPTAHGSTAKKSR
jgi:CheY-like chemotaxis protein